MCLRDSVDKCGVIVAPRKMELPDLGESVLVITAIRGNGVVE